MTAEPDGEPPDLSPRQRLSADERRSQIVAAARSVFVERGLAGARTRDIAAAADVTEALVYKHFRSKEELFEAAVVTPLEETVARMVELSGAPPPDFDETGEAMYERTRQYLTDLLHGMEEMAPLLGVMLFGDAHTASGYFSERIAPFLTQVRRVVELNLSSWRHREFDVDLVVQSVFGAAWFHTTVARLGGRPVDHEAVADSITRLVFDGLRLPEGPEPR
ncbi:TetR/AcrR family transcriptional regulator [Geodermatophilus sp. TF02-6]|uniref:TetR/AcrR family transcriptional regulator n=1 Tax=Geodermatophilus sp. TF02-6 TaxID=2250575 RepID=UPI001313FFE7|nr:TetR/AcrR family transcriptional regulator [Geodermatophilus sp. TF02-6]